MEKNEIVVILSLGMTIIIYMYITLKTSTNRMKTVCANIFMLIGMMLFFWGMSEVVIKLLYYLKG